MTSTNAILILVEEKRHFPPGSGEMDIFALREGLCFVKDYGRYGRLRSCEHRVVTRIMVIQHCEPTVKKD